MTNKKILVLDDEESIVELIRDILSQKDYEVKGFTDAKEALECILKETFDVVLTDLTMPKMSGIEVLKKVKKISPQTEVIIITAYATLETAIEAVRLGAYDYLPKPFEIDDLKHRVGKCLDKKVLVEEVVTLRDIVSLYEVSQALSSSMGLKQLFDLILELVCRILNADSSSILLLDENTKTLRIEASRGLELELEDIEKIRIKVGEKISGWVAKSGETLLLINGLHKYSLFSHLKSRNEVKCAIVTPLKVGESILGVLTLNSLKNVGHFSEREQKLFAIFANNAALAIKDAKAYDKLKELDRLKSEFISNVSHELRTPLTAIKGSIELLLDSFGEELSETAKKLLDITKNNAERLVKLVGEILDFSKVEAGILPISKKEMDVSSLIKQTVEELKIIADGKGLYLCTELIESPVNIVADSNRIKQVLVNLIGNSLKFTKEGGIIVGVRLLEEEAIVAVKDTGLGIPEESKTKMFERFYMVDSSLRKKTSGFGIGLSLSKSIIEAHNGKIWFESKLGEGSTFYFSLPVK
ncbi:MAG: response regulator [Candidatus Firestonebacteria bacterium]